MATQTNVLANVRGGASAATPRGEAASERRREAAEPARRYRKESRREIDPATAERERQWKKEDREAEAARLEKERAWKKSEREAHEAKQARDRQWRKEDREAAAAREEKRRLREKARQEEAEDKKERDLQRQREKDLQKRQDDEIAEAKKLKDQEAKDAKQAREAEAREAKDAKKRAAAEAIATQQRAQDEEHSRTVALVWECRRQYMSCLEAAAAVRLWQSCIAGVRSILLVLFLCLLARAAYLSVAALLHSQQTLPFVAQLLIALAIGGMLWWLNRAALERPNPAAATFVNLADKFLQAANVRFGGSFEAFSARFDGLTSELEAARAAAPQVPAWAAKAAASNVQAWRLTASKPNEGPPFEKLPDRPEKLAAPPPLAEEAAAPAGERPPAPGRA